MSGCLVAAFLRPTLHSGTFPNRERDEVEVRNYYRALDYLDTSIAEPDEMMEVQIQTLHGLVMTGKAVLISGRTERHP